MSFDIFLLRNLGWKMGYRTALSVAGIPINEDRRSSNEHNTIPATDKKP